MKIAVLGGDGFCGWPTSLHLSDAGHEVHIVDNLSRRWIDTELGVQSLTPMDSIQERTRIWHQETGRRIRFFEACAEGVMCPIGRGRIDYPAVRALLTEIGYAGYITIEQERDPRNAAGSLADLTASRDFLRRTGF